MFKRKTESHEEAARRKLRRVGEAQATGGACAIDSESTNDVDRMQSDLFQPVEVTMAEVDTLTDRERRAPDRLPPAESLRDFAASDGRRKRKRPVATCADAAPDEDTPCKKSACVAARAERDEACAERDRKVAELQLLRSQLMALAAAVGGDDSELPVAARAFQLELMEILDDVHAAESGDEESGDEQEAASSIKTPPSGAGAGR